MASWDFAALDSKDRQILAELDLDSSSSFSAIAKNVRLSQEVVRYRIKRFEDGGVIFKYFAVINPAKFGKSIFKVLLRLHNLAEGRKSHIVKFLCESEATAWVAEIDGNFDIAFTAFASTPLALDAFLDSFLEKFNENIAKKKISVNVWGNYLPRSYLSGTKKVPAKAAGRPSYTSQSGETPLDRVDQKILWLLGQNCRMNSVEIAQQTGVSPDTVLFRMRRMKKEGVITKFTVMLNHSAIGQLHYKVLVFANVASAERVKKFLGYCSAADRIVYVIKSLGEWDFELDVEAESPEQFRAVMAELTSKFSGVVEDYESLLVFKLHKYTLFPEKP
ncbi:MAG: Lrp/AsnC family transcriptional regulator [Candidatus Diapherotrites archaeon]|nr:Lrp/AsnC family transcriptional regulator [Candidatus Diapherotrites archaeon]